MATDNAPSLAQTFPVWGRIGMMSFGGPAAQIALMHDQIVDRQTWLTEQQFLNAISFCMLLPGPEAMQIATYAGWRLNGVRGGLLAGTLFVLPGALVILALASLYAILGQVPLVQALFLGVQAAVLGIVLKALFAVMKRALNAPAHWALAAFGFVALFFFAVPFPVVILLAAAIGAVIGGPQSEAAPPLPKASPVGTVAVWLALWGAPLAVLWLVDPAGILLQIGLFFSKLAVVTFGGAYAVLAYMAQQVVTDFNWLTAEQMIDGLGLAETTPGPLILVTEFVGFLAALGQGGWAMAIAGAALTLWVTFVPCFLWIFAAAPYVDWIATRPRLTGALRGITASVVGVIANLSVWFALHVLFGSVVQAQAGILSTWVPDLSSLNLAALGLAALSAYLLIWRTWPIGAVLALAASGGLAANLAGLA